MRFSADRQPRYAVYAIDAGAPVLVGRYGSLATALEMVAALLEYGMAAYHDVN